MSKMKLLKQIVDDLKNLSSSLDELYQAMEHSDVTTDGTPPMEHQNQKESCTDTAIVTLEEVRAVLADKSRLGFTKDIKNFIIELGVTKLSEVKPQDYRILLKKAEGLGND